MVQVTEWLAHESPGPHRHAFGFNADESKRVERNEYSTNRRIAFGFNSDEQNRIDRANIYSSLTQTSFYPLVDWRWNREACSNYLTKMFGVTPPRSCCVQCPFAKLSPEAISRLRNEPNQVARSLLIEYTSLCFNHRSSLYKNRTLMSVLRADHNTAAIDAFHSMLARTPMATYRVRRIMTSKGHGHRCTQRIDKTTLDQLISEKALTPMLSHEGDYKIKAGFAIKREPDTFPAREEFYVSAPTSVASRARHGIPWFEAKWIDAGQTALF